MLTNRPVIVTQSDLFTSMLQSGEVLNVRGHRADEMTEATASAASEAPGGPRG
jgi:hypothetical protein